MALRVLITSPDASLAARIERALAAAGEGGAVMRRAELEGAREHLAGEPCDLVVLDGRLLAGEEPGALLADLADLPDAPATVVLDQSGSPERRSAYQAAGATAVVDADASPPALASAVRALVERLREHRSQRAALELGRDEPRLSDLAATRAPAMLRLVELARSVVKGSSSLLILGETGVGKEVLARAVHAEGARARGPFVPIHCAAIPESLLESELFGHAEGAFTGAGRARRGLFELAHRGTVFLDEIGELPTHLQTRLLRVLQERRVRPIGSDRAIDVDLRVMAATNRDLEGELAAGRFRADLYYWLSVVTLVVPPLRERREDVPTLVARHVERFARALGRPVRGVDDEALDLLVRYPWPGNVRELANVVERAVLLAPGELVRPTDLPDDVRRMEEPGRRLTGVADEAALLALPLKEARERLLEGFERRYLEALLVETRGRVGAAAQRAGLSERGLYEKMRRLGLSKEAFRR